MAALAYTPSRGEVVDFSMPLMVQYSKILGKLGQPELDPWSFHLPLEPYVWLSIIITLLLVSVVMVLLSLTSQASLTHNLSPCWTSDVFQLLRVLLQQGDNYYVSLTIQKKHGRISSIVNILNLFSYIGYRLAL